MANNDRCQDCGRLLPADDWSSVCCDACYLARGIDISPTEKDAADPLTKAFDADGINIAEDALYRLLGYPGYEETRS